MKAVFLDRDGVININPTNNGYVCNWKDFTFVQNALNAVSSLVQNGFHIFIITNQAGIGRGLFTEDQLAHTHSKMLKEIERYGGCVEKIYYCPHHPDDNCECRKPKSGMLHKASDEHSIDLSNAFFVGDSIKDIDAAAAVGTIPILVLTGHGRASYRFYTEHAFSASLYKPARIFTNLYSASRWLINQ